MQQHFADRNLSLDLVRVTEAAALASGHFLGKGDKDAVDAAAVDAMRIAFQSMHIRGTIVIGEGEKDEAPMLYKGEQVGYGDGIEVDVAVDPIDGTTCVANGQHNAVAAVAIAPRGHMFDPGHSFYCQKLVVGSEAANVVDLDAPLKDNLHNIAKALGKQVNELNVFVLDKPRHADLIKDIRVAGARVLMHREGDIAGAIMAADPRNSIDLMIGVGGTPEAIVTACALKGSGAQMLTRMAPKTEEERKLIETDGIDIKAIRCVDDLITSDDCFFAMSGVTDGELLDGVHYEGNFAVTSSMSSRGRTGTIRYLTAWHNIKKLAKMSSINY
ncbi:MAG TPA: fructose-bisphosphatase class II [Succinivibrionaceae bacterium]|nr:class II fructose-bisphosphatase [Succinivibrio sp.]HAR79641.1 fructose-bisphosphatase class II [Succinivibrionaceae bacterium]